MMHNDAAMKRPVFLLARSPILDNEKDMTRTPTTPRSPPAPITTSPVSTSNGSHDGKVPPGIGGSGAIASTSGVSSVGGGMLPRGAHLPSYRSSTSSSTMSSTSSSSLTSAGSEPGSDGGYIGGTGGGHGARPPPHHQLRTQYTTTGGHRFKNSYGSSSGGQLQGQQGMGRGGGGGGGGGMPRLSHMQSDYRVGSGGQYDTRYTNWSRPPLAAAGMYNQPAQAYSTYPSESYAPPYRRTNYSRPLSTGSLSSVSTASSRPGFSSLDEFPTMNDHRSTFAPSVGGAGEASSTRPPHHRNSAGALTYNYGGGGGVGEFHHYHSHPYRQIHDHPSNSGGAGSYVEGGPGAGATSPLSPLSYDEHQPLLSLSLSEQRCQQQQTSSVVLCGESPSDELGGQTISEEMSRKLNIQDHRTSSQQASGQPRMQSSMTTGGSFDEGASCILILEHPRDIEAHLNEKAVLRCTARISRHGQGRSQSKVEQVDEEGEGEEEPNLLWYKDAEPLIGEIDCEFVVEKVTEKDMGVYYCLVSHPTQEHIQRQSNVARLTIKKDQGMILGTCIYLQYCCSQIGSVHCSSD